MTLAERLSEYVRAAFSGIYVRSFEHDDAIAEIARLCRDQAGPWPPGTSTGAWLWPVQREGQVSSPAASIRWRHFDPCRPWPRPTAPPSWCSATSTGSWARPRSSRPSTPSLPPASRPGPSSSSWLRVVQLPVELEKLFVVIEHDLPGRDQLRRSPAAWPPSRASCPRIRRPGRRARRGGGADPRRGRERLQPVAGRGHGRLAARRLWEIKIGRRSRSRAC